MKKKLQPSLIREFGGLWNFLRVIPRRRNFAVGGCVLLASIAEGFGVATLLPLIAVLGDEPSKANAMSQAILGLMDTLHLPHDPFLLLGLIAGGLMLKAALILLAMRQVGFAVADVVTGMRADLIDALIHARWSYYVRQPVGRFTNALSGEAGRAGEAYNAATQMFSHAMQALVYLLLATFASWKLALLTIAVTSLMIGSLNRLVLTAKHNAKMQVKVMRSLLSRLTDVLIGIKPMKAMSRQARFGQLFQADLKVLRRASRRQIFAKHMNKALQEPILTLCVAAGIYVALKLLHMPVAQMVIMSLLLIKTVSLFGKAQQEFQNYHANVSGYQAVRGAISGARAARENVHRGLAPVFQRAIEFRDIRFSYATRLTLDGVNLEIGAGELIALTGPSGAGKTTLIDLLLGFHTPQSGEVLVDGVPLSKLDVLSWRSMIGYVPQELILFHDSIAANVSLGETCFTPADIERALRDAGAWEFVRALTDGVETIVGERGGALSGGQRQRIALARALVHRPRLLILDEATSALDPHNEALIIDNVVKLAREHRLTVISVTHHPAWLAAATRIERLEAGRLISDEVPLRSVAS